MVAILVKDKILSAHMYRGMEIDRGHQNEGVSFKSTAHRTVIARCVGRGKDCNKIAKACSSRIVDRRAIVPELGH
jgi:hypothetical protein